MPNSPHYQATIERYTGLAPMRIAVVPPVQHTVFEAGLVDPVLIEPTGRIAQASVEVGHKPGTYEIIDTEHGHAAVAKAAELPVSGGWRRS